MEITISYVNNRFKMETITKSNKKRTSNIARIEDTIMKLPIDPIVIKVDKKDAKIIYKEGIKLILKDYQKHLNHPLYETIFNGISEDTPIVKNVKKINKLKLAVLSLSSVVFVSIAIPKIVPSTNTTIENEVVTTYDTPSSQTEIEQQVVVEEPDQLQLADESNYELLTRLEQSKELLDGKLINNSNLPIGSRLTDFALNKIVDFINSDNGKYCFEVCNDFGVDPYGYVCLMMNESSLEHNQTIPGGENYNGFAVGISQLETPKGQEITAFNYTTNQEETTYETMENATNIKSNIKLGIMKYQNILNRYHGNEKLAFQSYNYGHGLVDLIVAIYADEIGTSFDDVVNNYEDIGWLKYVKEAHENPKEFAKKYEQYEQYGATIRALKNWQYGTYGNGDYISDLYSYYIGIYSKNIVNGNIIQTNLTNNEVTKVALTDVNENNHII